MRLIFIGDIHGCYDELTRLLARVDPQRGDRVISVGDIVSKGPSPERCLALWRERGYLAVLGNHEERALAAGDPLARYFRNWPRHLDFPDQGVAVVHGGVLPAKKFTSRRMDEQAATLTTLRHLRSENGEWMPVPKNHELSGDRFWSELWDGDRTIVYGHTPREEIRRDRKAIGLDTACVYGGKLSSAIWSRGGWEMLSVPAARSYAARSRK